ncbi:hypothetical protein FRC09_017123 [Ceratobasidium sp. 395]|nr:hypothetical protein FRC09_017123 [Ceratobasidium sp. 395]
MLCDNDEGDWVYHSVNHFVDHDMVMRYLGRGVGHFDQHASTEPQAASYAFESQELETRSNKPDEDEEITTTEDVTDGSNAYRLSDNPEDSGLDRNLSNVCSGGESGSKDNGDTEDDDFIEDLYELQTMSHI